MGSGGPVVGVPMEEKACCFPIPRGAKTIAIIEFVFIGLSIIGVILGFVAGGRGLITSIVTVLFLVGLAVCAFFLIKAVNDNNAGYTLPYAILKIIHLVFQGITIIIYIVGVAGMGAYTAQYGGGQGAGVLTGFLVFMLLVTVAWFILGIFGVVVAFKTRGHIQRNSGGMGGPVGGVVVQQPAYVQPPPAYQQPPK